MRASTLTVVLAIVATSAVGQTYREEDPIPPGARGKVLLIRGKVVEIRGLSRGVSGKTEALAAALKELGAKTSGMEIRVELSSDVMFDFDKSTLRAEATPALEKVVTVFQSYPDSTTTVEGHTDSVGNDAYNQRLSEQRAQSVVTWFRGHGVAGSIEARGWGETKPLLPNANANGSDNPENRQKNRRVEIVIRRG